MDARHNLQTVIGTQGLYQPLAVYFDELAIAARVRGADRQLITISPAARKLTHLLRPAPDRPHPAC